MGCGLRAFAALEERYPEAGDLLRAVFEDEALNVSPSPALLAAYLKRRLGYDEERETDAIEAECGSLRLVFEHDIEEDGE